MKHKWGLFTRRTLSNLILVCAGVLLYLLFSNLAAARTAVEGVVGIFMPFIVGLSIAYLLNLPVRFLENRILHRLRYKRALAITIVYLLALVVLAVLLVAILPQLADSVVGLVSNIPTYVNNLNEITGWLTRRFALEEGTLDFILLNYRDIANQVIAWVRGALPDLVGWTMRFGSGLVSMLTATIASIYMLGRKEKLLSQLKMVCYALLPRQRANSLMRVSTLANRVFSGFIGGKIIDSVIIGLICYAFMWIMNTFVVPMPMALLISIIIGVTNIIPFFGPFIGAIPSVIILLLIEPWSALWFTIFIIVLQQFDGNYLGPKILGDSTGLPAFWVLVAIIVGGGLFGFAGMVLGVPTMAVLYTVTSDVIARRLQQKGINREGQPLPESEASEKGDLPDGQQNDPGAPSGGE